MFFAIISSLFLHCFCQVCVVEVLEVKCANDARPLLSIKGLGPKCDRAANL